MVATLSTGLRSNTTIGAEIDDPATLLDATMPQFDVREVHEVVVHPGPEAVWDALHEVSLGAVPVFRDLMTLRELPALLVGQRGLTADVDRPILEQMTASGFLLLEEHPPAETVLGLATRRWRLRGVGGVLKKGVGPPGTAGWSRP